MNNLTKECIDGSWYVINRDDNKVKSKYNNEDAADFHILSEKVNEEKARYRIDIGYDDFENVPEVKQFYVDSMDEAEGRIALEKNHNPGTHIYYTLHVEKSIEINHPI